MKILIVNDDGIYAHGIARLAKAAVKHGEVWVVAPDSERSGASHGINLHKPIEVREVEFPVPGVKAYKTTGTPSDCARIGILNIVPGKPDVVLSGVNHGYNAGTDIMYSGTVGAAMEASFQGIPAIAFSESMREGEKSTDAFLEEVLAKVIDFKPGPDEILNVNFPGKCEPCEVKGILWDRFASRRVIFKDKYDATPLPDGGVSYMVNGTMQFDFEEGSDLQALLDRYISIGIIKNIC